MDKNIRVIVDLPQEAEEAFCNFVVEKNGKIMDVVAEDRPLEIRGYRVMPQGDGYTVAGIPKAFGSLNETITFIESYISDFPEWRVTFIWGYSLKLMTLIVRADTAEIAVREAFGLVGANFENQLISVVRLPE